VTLQCVQALERPTCPHCGSDDLSADATVWWSGEAWELSDGNHDEGSCNVCQRQITFICVPL
jgi:hypothetical protein